MRKNAKECARARERDGEREIEREGERERKYDRTHHDLRQRFQNCLLALLPNPPFFWSDLRLDVS